MFSYLCAFFRDHAGLSCLWRISRKTNTAKNKRTLSVISSCRQAVQLGRLGLTSWFGGGGVLPWQRRHAHDLTDSWVASVISFTSSKVANERPASCKETKLAVKRRKRSQNSCLSASQPVQATMQRGWGGLWWHNHNANRTQRGRAG